MGGDSRGRARVYLWLIRADVRQKPTQHCKAITFQLKNNFFKKDSLSQDEIIWFQMSIVSKFEKPSSRSTFEKEETVY